MKLELANKIISNEIYKNKMSEITAMEKERPFCSHGMAHCLDVARIAMLICYEKNIPADAETIYAAALLHDIGRAEEYRNGSPHDTAGAELAEAVLDDIGCIEEKQIILRLINSHRDKDCGDNTLEGIFSTADRLSRLCFCCEARSECNWQKDRLNKGVTF